MVNFIIKCFVFVLIPLGIAGCGESPKIRPLFSDSVILAFGDSLTWGTGATKGMDYPSVLAELSGMTVINAGIPGEKTDEGMRRLPLLLEEHHPALVILCHGGNDILANRKESVIFDNLERMIHAIRSENADVVLLGVPQKNILLNSAELYADLAKKYRIPFDDDLIPDILSHAALKSDYIHPNAQGYQQLAERVWDLIQISQE